ncbi:DJ-1/PfpI family protein [Nevskia ramosa]|uniref:DJ-1/PfpI family protein n=1 Tax=Nevskia ramosa TaxID=64002 RepID=UPI003D13E2E0
MKIACVLHPGFTSLDMIAPITVWQFVPGVQFEFIAASKGPIATDTGLEFIATHSYQDASPAPDVLFVPGGGQPTFDALKDQEMLDLIARLGARAQWVTSVCTGSLLVGAAGLLQGYRSACHWYPKAWLSKFGAIPDDARVVIDRNRASGGGVTAGMDFALRLAAEWGGEPAGRLIELIVEYAPEPPFGTGRPELADAETLATARQISSTMMSETVVDQAAARLNVRRLAEAEA